MTGRPSSFTPEIAAEILRRLAEGESLRAICRDEGMPHRDTVHGWLLDPARKDFSDQYARARELQADALVDECLEIADDSTNDFVEKQLGEDGPTVEVVNHEHISRSKLRVDTRKWAAGKLAPKKYGERLAVTGADGGAIKHQDVTPTRGASAKEVTELGEIFGTAVVAAAAGAARGAAGNKGRDDRVVRAKPHKGGRKKP